MLDNDYAGSSHKKVTIAAVGQAQPAHRMAWLDPIDDGGMVQQSVANWTRIQAKMLDQYSMSGS